jgi:hypothetical protein
MVQHSGAAFVGRRFDRLWGGELGGESHGICDTTF